MCRAMARKSEVRIHHDRTHPSACDAARHPLIALPRRHEGDRTPRCWCPARQCLAAAMRLSPTRPRRLRDNQHVSDILDIFRSQGALLEGHFLLSSGLHSAQYLQCARVLMDTGIASELGARLAAQLKSVGVAPDVVVAPGPGGHHRGSRGRAGFRLPVALHRARRNDHDASPGLRARTGEAVVVVEDVVTTGKSTREVMARGGSRGRARGRGGLPGGPQFRKGRFRGSLRDSPPNRGRDLERGGLPVVRGGIGCGKAGFAAGGLSDVKRPAGVQPASHAVVRRFGVRGISGSGQRRGRAPSRMKSKRRSRRFMRASSCESRGRVEPIKGFTLSDR